MKKLMIMLLCLLTAALPALAEGAMPAVAEFNGGSITYDEAYPVYADTLQSYADFGWSAIDHSELAMEVLQSLVQEAVLYNKAQELGLTEIPAETLTELKAVAHANYESLVSYYIDFYSSEDMSAEEARAATEAYLEEEGQSEEALLASMTADWWRGALEDYVCQNVAITEEHIWDYAETLATTQSLQFAEDPTYFDYLYMNDDLIAYYPEGMRYIKHILIGFDVEGALSYQQLVGEGEMCDADPAALDAVYAALDERVAEVENLLLEGASFDELMRTHGDDEMMLYEPYSISGYMVQPGSELFVPEFVNACFELENVGDISEPIRTPGGVHFILYAGDVPAGPAALESIVDMVAAEARDQLITETYDAQIAAWVAEAQPVYHPEYLLQ